jgi:hypothetical protein
MVAAVHLGRRNTAERALFGVSGLHTLFALVSNYIKRIRTGTLTLHVRLDLVASDTPSIVPVKVKDGLFGENDM